MKARNVDKANNIYDEKKIPTTTKLFSVKCQCKCFIEKNVIISMQSLSVRNKSSEVVANSSHK